MSPQLRLILPLSWIGGGLAVGLAARAILSETPAAFATGVVWFFLLLVLAILSEMKPVPYSLGRANKDESLTITLILLTLFAFDWPAAVLLAVASVAVADLAADKPYYKVLFNGSMYAIATGLAGVAYHLSLPHLQGLAGILPAVWVQILARLGSGVVYYLANVTLLMLILSRLQGLRLSQMMVWGLRDSAMVNLALIAIAIAMSVFWELHPGAAVILVPPLFMAKLGYQGYTRLRSEAESMLAALADFLDLRDHNTGRHSLRVSEMCYGVACLLGLPEDQALAVKAVARVHDVGKVVVRDAVLQKAGTLSPHERFEMQSHVEAGGQILSHLSVYKGQLPILLQHHERFDGRGYPAGLRGETIETGARILAVCDAFDTMTSDRPYRSAISNEVAMIEVQRHAGTQFDPKVVEALERWLIAERKLRIDWRAVLGKTAADEPGVAFQLLAGPEGPFLGTSDILPGQGRRPHV